MLCPNAELMEHLPIQSDGVALASRALRRENSRRRPVRGRICAAAVVLLLLGSCPPRHVAPSGARVMLTRFADGLTSPVGIAFPNDGSRRLFIVDQIGLVRVLDSAGASPSQAGSSPSATVGTLLPTPFLDVRYRMVPLSLTYDERGLLGLAFHPYYAQNGRFFVYYNAPKGPDVPAEFDSQVHLSEFRVSPDDPNRADPASERILLVQAKPQYNHNGGQLAFGPDGFLYVSIGDGGAGDDVGPGHNPDIGNGQDKSVLLGKILRIAVDRGDPYAIPPDNPFVGDPAARGEIWAYGLRNPWRFSFDMGDPARLFVADVGQDLFEEVDLIVKGGNYGWHIREGGSCFNPAKPSNPLERCADTAADGTPVIGPIIQYGHTDHLSRPIGSAIIGGYVYRGSAVASLSGAYIFADFSPTLGEPDGRIFTATQDDQGDWVRRELEIAGRNDGRLHRFILGFGQDADGEVYVTTTNNLGPIGSTGAVFKLGPQ
jgi:glucose/arabinose dehydrogenase